MNKLGHDFELGYIETLLLEEIRQMKKVRSLQLLWQADHKPHMKWLAGCSNPRFRHTVSAKSTEMPMLLAYGPTPRYALENLKKLLLAQRSSK